MEGNYMILIIIALSCLCIYLAILSCIHIGESKKKVKMIEILEKYMDKKDKIIHEQQELINLKCND